ncbi:MAG: TetR/AcrR family transcriptional regulator [Stackebrandtia sp.]
MPPPNRERRDQLADAAMRVLAADGTRGLTHRAVDTEGGVPSGTTSRYFPTRDALLQAVADRTRQLQLAAIERLAPGPGDPARLPEAIARNFREVLAARPDHPMVLFELLLEGSRRPELRSALAEAARARTAATLRICGDAGVKLSESDAKLLLMMAEGVALAVLTTDPEALDEVEGNIRSGAESILAKYGG